VTSLRAVLSGLLKSGAADAVVREDAGEWFSLKFSNSRISVTKYWSLKNVDVFAAYKKRLVSTTIRSLDSDSIKGVCWT